MKTKYIILGVALLLVSCDNGKRGKLNEPYDGGHGIGIDTATVQEIERYEDSLRAAESVNEKPVANPSSTSSSRVEYDEPEYNNMRGFDPASEDDMPDNGMSRYMENNDEEGWD